MTSRGWRHPTSRCVDVRSFRLLVENVWLIKRRQYVFFLTFTPRRMLPQRSRKRVQHCTEHLTVESYTVIRPICQISYLLLLGISLPTHSFIPDLKPSFSANPSHRSPSFLFFGIHYMIPPDCLLLLLSTSVFTFLLLRFLVVGSVRYRLSWLVLAFERTLK